MSRRRSDAPPRIVLVDKPAGPTSFDVVRAVRRVTRERRVGHGGTLDPFATGLLIVGVGPATRLMNFVAHGAKTYEATMCFGRETDSGDLTGEVVLERDVVPDVDTLRAAMAGFVGAIDQVPPRHSAVRIEGRRAYARARAGEDFEVPARRVHVESFRLLDAAGDRATFEVTCSGGTYVRSLARDLARAVDAAAHLTALRRTRSGSIAVEDAVALDALDEAAATGRLLREPAVLTRDWPRLVLDDEAVDRVRCGTQPDHDWWASTFDVAPERVALVDPDGALVGVAEGDDDGELRLAMVLPTGGAS